MSLQWTIERKIHAVTPLIKSITQIGVTIVFIIRAISYRNEQIIALAYGVEILVGSRKDRVKYPLSTK